MALRKPITYVGLVFGLTLGSSVVFPACVGYSTCEDHGKSCGNARGGAAAGVGGETAGGDSSGGTGNGGAAGSGATSGDGTAAGASGHSGGSAAGSGAAGMSGAPPCDGDCMGSTPVCDEATNTCVECLAKGDCKSPKPACDTVTNTCVECTTKTDCSDAAKPVCDTKAHACVACLADADCKDPSAARCDQGTCTPCTDKAQCTHLAGKSVCDLSQGQCVQCTGSDYGACGKDSASQTPLVCDSLARTCSTNKEHAAGLCIPCVSDAHCALGEMCVLQKFKDADVGYFCHSKQGDIGNGAPADCTVGGQPYVGVINGAKSIDGQSADICALRKSTCVARNQFSQKDCAPTSSPNDTLCGFAPPDDAKCAKYGTTTYRCTMRCGSDDDCPSSFTCATGLAQPVCNLQ